MPIKYYSIAEVLGICTELLESRDNPLIIIKVKYKLSDGHVQDYIQPTKADEILNILAGLRERRLVKKSQFNDYTAKVQELEMLLLDNPAYLAMNVIK